jgi:hypothetical protein
MFLIFDCALIINFGCRSYSSIVELKLIVVYIVKQFVTADM